MLVAPRYGAVPSRPWHLRLLLCGWVAGEPHVRVKAQCKLLEVVCQRIAANVKVVRCV